MFVLIATSLYLMACLLTYSSGDPGWSNSRSPAEVANVGGYVGASIADVGYWVFGFAVFLIPVSLSLFVWKYQRVWKTRAGDKMLPPILFFVGLVLTVFGVSGIESYYGFSSGDHLAHPAGGILGDFISRLSSSYVQWEIAVAALLLMIVVGTWFLGAISWTWVSEHTGRLFLRSVSFLAPSGAKRSSEKLPPLDDAAPAKPASRKRAKYRKTDDARTDKKAASRSKKTAGGRVEPNLGAFGDKLSELPEASADGEAGATAQAPQPGRPQASKRAPVADRAAGKSQLPSLSLLDKPKKVAQSYSKSDIVEMSRVVEEMLDSHNVQVSVVDAKPGPIVTQLNIQPAAGIKASKIVSLSRDLARSLSVTGVRVVDNVPGTPYVGIEVPNASREIVRLIDGLSSDEYASSDSPLTIVLGKDIQGNTVVSSLDRMPHLLVAGTTGSGKSVCMNAMLLSILYKSTPDQVRLVMVDPKMLEFSVYEGIPHLLTPVITDMDKTENALNWCLTEMDLRYRLMTEFKVRSLNGFNEMVASSDPIPDPFQSDEENVVHLKRLPYIVVVIDELADLILVMGRKAEDLILRIAQKARAAGIHLIVATQRPSADVIRGVLKANIPTRIGFKVASSQDSRVILDQNGAETLLGQGDMLFIPPNATDAMRVHGAFVHDDEVNRVADFLRKSAVPEYVDEVIEKSAASQFASGEHGSEEDELYDEAVDLVARTRYCTISNIQNTFRIGYNRSARIVKAMEQAGVVSQADSNSKRKVLVPPPPED